MSSTRSEEPKLDERRTKELCGHERAGVRCMRPKGHSHEHVAFTGGDPITWPA